MARKSSTTTAKKATKKVAKRPVKKKGQVSQHAPRSRYARQIDNLLDGLSQAPEVNDDDTEDLSDDDMTPDVEPDSTTESENELDSATDDTEQPTGFRQGAVVRHSSKNRKYNWPEIKAHYIEGVTGPDGVVYWPTLTETAKYFNANLSRVGEHSSMERWADQRIIAQRRINIAKRDERNKELAREAVEIDTSALNVGKVGLRLVLARLAHVARDMAKHSETREEMQRLVEMGAEIDMKKLRSPVYHLEMESLARAASTFHELTRKALGEDIQKHEVSGPGGSPIGIDVHAELMRDDPTKLTQLLRGAAQIGLFKDLGINGDEEELRYQEAEIVDEQTVEAEARAASGHPLAEILGEVTSDTEQE